MGENIAVKSVCLFCGDEFEYQETSSLMGSPPKRKFCGDSSWTDTTFSDSPNYCKRAKNGLPSKYKSYIWLCKIYRREIGYSGDTEIKPYKSGEWEDHYAVLSAKHDTDAREYYS